MKRCASSKQQIYQLTRMGNQLHIKVVNLTVLSHSANNILCSKRMNNKFVRSISFRFQLAHHHVHLEKGRLLWQTPENNRHWNSLSTSSFYSALGRGRRTSSRTTYLESILQISTRSSKRSGWSKTVYVESYPTCMDRKHVAWLTNNHRQRSRSNALQNEKRDGAR